MYCIIIMSRWNYGLKIIRLHYIYFPDEHSGGLIIMSALNIDDAVECRLSFHQMTAAFPVFKSRD